MSDSHQGMLFELGMQTSRSVLGDSHVDHALASHDTF